MGSYIFLVSYNTLVAYIQGDGVLFVILRLVYGYTSTSAKHIAKFRKKFHHVSEKHIGWCYNEQLRKNNGTIK